MHSISTSRPVGAPSPQILQRRRIAGRISASDAVAGLVAELCFGPSRRGDVVALASMTGHRVAEAGAHG